MKDERKWSELRPDEKVGPVLLMIILLLGGSMLFGWLLTIILG